MITTRLGVARLSICAALVLAACSGQTNPGGSPDTVGTAEVALQLAPGLTFNSASYALTGPASFARSATVDLSHSTAVTFTVGGLPAGGGYSITVTGTLSDGTTTCMGSSAAFAIMARATTAVSIHLTCREQPRTGSARINGTVNICPVIDALSASPAEIEVGNAIALGSSAHDTDGVPAALTYAWTASSGTVATPAAANTSFVCTVPGTVTVTLTVSDGDCGEAQTQTVVCSPAVGAPPAVRINEVESNQGTPGDWVELFNAGATPVDVSGWIFKDNDDTHSYAVAAGTTIAPGAYLVLEEAGFMFGLGGADSARLYTSSGTTVVDSYSWTAHATTTYGRCPNGSGEFATTVAPTKGSANECALPVGGAGGAGGNGGAAGAGGGAGMGTGGAPTGGSGGGPTALTAWPGQNAVVTLDNANGFPSNLSGLTYQPATGANAPVLWASLNSPATLLRLQADGAVWTSPAGEWAAGKNLVYPNGMGNPDSESLSRAEEDSPAVYVAAERDNLASGVSRLSILRYDTSVAGTTLTATHEWNLTADLPAVGANLGLEAITWIPDATLVAAGFVDDSTGALYNPASYAGHGTGLFAVGVEATGMIHVYALDHTGGTFHRVTSFSSGQPGTMGMEFDRESGYLWAQCDNTCGNHAAVLEIETAAISPNRGHFQVRRIFDRAGTLPDSNNEGIAIGPDSECVGGFKPFFWSDDSNFAMHALRRDSIPCGKFL